MVRDLAFFPALHSGRPRTSTKARSTRTVPFLSVDQPTSSRPAVRSGAAVEDRQAKRCLPAVAGDRDQEPVNLVFGPGVGVALMAALRHLFGHADAGGWATAQLAGGHGVIERGPQHHAQDLDAATGQTSTGSEVVEPPRHVVALETIDANGSEARLDVAARPLIHESRLA
jgi:hypothetical protein